MENYKLFSSIIDGMVDVHVHNIVHRDLKPDNIFFMDGKAKIGDFGLARNLNDDSVSTEPPFISLSQQSTTSKSGQATVISHFSSVAGTYQYMSPELKVHYNQGT